MTESNNVRHLSNVSSRTLGKPRLGHAGRAKAPKIDKFDPAPRVRREWRHGPKPAYVNFVAALLQMVESTDLNNPNDFHALLWQIVQMGGSQKFVAFDQGVSPTVVSRWVLGDQTPIPARRRGILMSAAISLRRAIDEGSPVPLRSYYGRRAPAVSARQVIRGVKDRDEN